MTSKNIFKRMNVLWGILIVLFWISFLSADSAGLWSTGSRASDYSSEPIWTYGGNMTAGNVEIADLNGDGTMDIVAAEYDADDYGDSSRIIALDGSSGDTLWTFWFNDGVRAMISGDINGDGVADIIGGGSYGTDLVTDGRVRVIDGVTGDEIWNFATGNSINDLAIGDFNNSGNPDVAVVGFDDYIYAIDGSTGDYIWRKYLGSLFINCVETGDVNGDGIDDVAYAHEYLVGFDNYMGVLDGSDGTEIWEETLPYYASDLILDDVDDDGFLEFVSGMHYGDDHGEIHVRDALTGSLEWSYDFGDIDHTNGKFYFLSADIDDDKDKDLIVGNYLGQRKVYVFDGDVNTPSLVSEELTRFCYQLTSGDVDNDGYLDIVAASFDRVQIINAASGELMWYYAVSGLIQDVKCADFDGDLWTDIAACGGAVYDPDPDITVWALKAIQTPVLWEYGFGENGNALDVVDLNQDGHDDVITVASGEKVNAIDGKTGDVLLWDYTPAGNLYAVTHGDFDNDGDQDVAVGGADNRVTALDGNSGDILWQFNTPASTVGRSALGSSDLNSDGADDVVAGSNDDYVYAIDGTTGLELWNYPAGSDVEEVFLAQMNDTGPLDVVCGLASAANKVLVLDGADGSFLWEYVCPNRVEYVDVFDINGDNVLDVAAGLTLVPRSVYMIDGATHDTIFTIAVDVNSTGYALGHGDLDGDNTPDIIVGGNYNVNTVYTFNGLDGSPMWSVLIGDEVESVLGYDVDVDGDDEAIVGGDNNKLYVFDGDGSELFSHNCADAVKHILVGDISADGEPNIACLTFGFIGVAYAFKSIVPEPNVPPYSPASPSPDDGATGVLVTASLS
ncbi:MAG: PQQ-binding-like beta-propeller repeat protein, partial [candidate division Zixibacteria bacterium]|nr:PQQ-binding-like beta-propeller repeat protein [candidate division Zixibacteria bacterium]NIR64324.1 PQQ-binding-like beta-propeller repeat protein [candidate division Zixibacteria bacterium]NIS15235.1 PQQ-binding-like beta-propeller repeat protein [candidate division Zixibacteria bacterium]NIS47110.1 PQQ-binding-like beta-propeller repeat protein [candidate division Zixibacteria bacterium]NIU16593.1 PQQ-binding-like beta-propeller repeat protein [candidate division Zixibacteria bacterium]